MKWNLRKYLTLNTYMYILLAIFLLAVYLIEKRDWTCMNSYDLTDACIKGDGMPYRGSRPLETDSPKELLQKINIASRTEQNSIKWRRAFILSCSIMFLVYILLITPSSLPHWTTFYLATITGFSVLYFSFNYYSYHRFKKPGEYIRLSTKYLKKM